MWQKDPTSIMLSKVVVELSAIFGRNRRKTSGDMRSYIGAI